MGFFIIHIYYIYKNGRCGRGTFCFLGLLGQEGGQMSSVSITSLPVEY